MVPLPSCFRLGNMAQVALLTGYHARQGRGRRGTSHA